MIIRLHFLHFFVEELEHVDDLEEEVSLDDLQPVPDELDTLWQR